MIDLGGERSFVRFWLPLMILAALVVFLFPRLGPRPDRAAIEAWDGLVLLVRLEPSPSEDLRLVASLPVATPGGHEEWLVVGEVLFPAGAETRPLLLATPRDSDLGIRGARRVVRDASEPNRILTRLSIHGAADLGPIGPSGLGALLRRGEWIDDEGARSIPDPILTLSHPVTFDPVRQRRWPGNSASFQADWTRFRDLDPGGLKPFIHERLTLPSDGVGEPFRSGARLPEDG